jgi:hypothetical protein
MAARSRAVYREVVSRKRIVFTTAGEVGTTLTLRAEVVASTPPCAPMLAGMEEGWRQSLEHLEMQVAAGR